MIESTIGKPGYEPARITIYVKDRGIVLEESSMALVNRDTGLIIAMGNAAEEAIDQAVTPVTAVNPLRRGIIASYMLAERMFCSYLRRALGYDRSMVKRERRLSDRAAAGRSCKVSGEAMHRICGDYMEWEGKGTFLHK